MEENTQKVIKKGGRALWGVRLFEEAKTAEDRRAFRSTRRRYDRRRNRIKLLQKEFEKEISKVDVTFYKKLNETKYNENDKVNKSILLTKDEKNMIKEYNDKFKTIYHLRKKLISDKSREDIRLVYLAIHHMIKYRGNFLYEADKFNVNSLDLVEKLDEVFSSFINFVPNLEISDDYKEFIDLNKIAEIIVGTSKNDIKISLKNELKNISTSKKFVNEFSKMIVGNKFKIKDLFMIEDSNNLSISFNGTDFEDKYNELVGLLGEEIETLNLLKQLYDTIFLKKLFNGSNNTSISDLMVEKYNQHKKDLHFLKELFSYDRTIYNKFFRTKGEMCFYDKYIHNVKNEYPYEKFKKELLRYLPDVLEKNNNINLINEYGYVKSRIENDEFLPKITDTDNGKYPYQLNKDELIKIIENKGQYYPFLLEKVNNKYKLVQLLEFKIPYYVGPLVSNKQSEFAWLERNINNVKITPFNFDEVVNKELTAEKFIKRMIFHCTYLLDEYALPNNSILYSKYKLMNELKQIKVNGQKISNDIQHKIIEGLFKNVSGSITDTKFKNYLYTLPGFAMYENNINITGYSADGRFANNLQSYIDFFCENGIFVDTSYNEDDADQIIEWITIFDDKDILEKKIKDTYLELSDLQIKKAISKKYSGWGKLSKKLLTTPYYKDKTTNIKKSIMDLMYETEENFMQIINNDEYKLQDMIKEFNQLKKNTILNYNLVKKLATSPATKKGIYQALKVVDEIVKYMDGNHPNNIMIEMVRGEDKKERKNDRKKYLLNLYEKAKEITVEYNRIHSTLEKTEKIENDKVYLYYLQEAKCMYCGKSINIEDLNGADYEIDHILPRTLIKDNSWDNKVLVCRHHNQEKGADLVLPKSFRNDYTRKIWDRLRKNGLMSAKKHYRLTRKEYSDEDIQGFINKQLVETRQITKHVANILNMFYKKTNIIYLKAGLSHNYRERYELFKFRNINDYHHAHDAYLAAVLGEYKEKYMQYMGKNIDYEMLREINNRLINLGSFKKLRYGFVINSLDDEVSDIINSISKKMDNFDAKYFNKIVEDTLYRNDILISRKTEIRSGQFFKQSILPMGKGSVELKKNMPTDVYGGYSNVETSYLTLVEYNDRRKLIGIPLEIVSKSKKDKNVKLDFIKQHLDLKNIIDVKIIKDFIPYEVLVNYKNHNIYVKGYSIANKACEISNAYQLKIPKDKMKK